MASNLHQPPTRLNRRSSLMSLQYSHASTACHGCFQCQSCTTRPQPRPHASPLPPRPNSGLIRVHLVAPHGGCAVMCTDDIIIIGKSTSACKHYQYQYHPPSQICPLSPKYQYQDRGVLVVKHTPRVACCCYVALCTHAALYMTIIKPPPPLTSAWRFARLHCARGVVLAAPQHIPRCLEAPQRPDTNSGDTNSGALWPWPSRT